MEVDSKVEDEVVVALVSSDYVAAGLVDRTRYKR